MPRAKKSAEVAPPPQIAAPQKVFSIADWQKSPDFQAQLRDVLNLPVVQMAFQTLMQSALPRVASIINPVAGVSPEAMDKSLAYAFVDRAGQVRLHDRLFALTRPKDANPKAHEQWGKLVEETE